MNGHALLDPPHPDRRARAHGRPRRRPRTPQAAQPTAGHLRAGSAMTTLLEPVRRQLAGEDLAGERKRSSTSRCGPRARPSSSQVWAACGSPLRRGGLLGELAGIGRPTAVRAVGPANGPNPDGGIVPCHRVIGSNGSLTGYGGGLRRRALAAGSRSQGQRRRLWSSSPRRTRCSTARAGPTRARPRASSAVTAARRSPGRPRLPRRTPLCCGRGFDKRHRVFFSQQGRQRSPQGSVPAAPACRSTSRPLEIQHISKQVDLSRVRGAREKDQLVAARRRGTPRT